VAGQRGAAQSELEGKQGEQTMRRDGGFSLTELIVVIGIGALITAVSFPVAKTMTSGNKLTTCAARLQHIGQAMKIYYLDEGAPPPYYPDPDGSGTMYGPGLLALVDTGHLRSETALNCPADTEHKSNTRYESPGVEDLNFTARSYFSLDPGAQTNSLGYLELNRYKYLSSRGLESTSTDPLRKRQLAPLRADGYPQLARGIPQPDDRTVITWCNYHFDKIMEGREGQYQALFWDGSVHKMPGSLFRTPDDVSAAWVVTPADDPTP
jgi:prepilin-type N-terminal cleavage/methylation domain-containing protein